MLDTDKAFLRAQALAARRALTAEQRAEKSEAIVRRIRAMPAWRSAHTVLFYVPTRGEVDVMPLLRQALQEGRRCLLPRCAPNCALELLPVEDLQRDLAPGVFGLMEPCTDGPDCAGQPIDMILVPGVAYDRQGWRIGYGKGYYDRLLACYRDRSALIAPAYAMQLVNDARHQAHDVPMHWIATEDALLNCLNGGK